MATIQHILQDFQAMPFANAIPVALALGALSLLFLDYIKGFIVTNFTKDKKSAFAKLPPVPVVPGLPVIGNVLQLREKKPYKTFTRWAETYGPIYSTRVGACTMVILNSTDVAKEALVTRFSSISNKKLSDSLMLLSFSKCMVAISDYNDFYKLIKRYLLTNVLGVNAQKRHRIHRDIMRENVSSKLHAHIKKSPQEVVDFREIFEFELFGVSLKQAFGKDVEESMYVEELGTRLSREEMFKVLVLDIEQGSVDMDWRDFFPYLKWIPNKSLEKRIQGYYFRRKAVMNALIDRQKKRIASGEDINCYIDYLLAQAKTLTIDQITMLVWETIIETTHTTSSTTEWALYHLARDPKRQDLLYEEIQNLCGSDKLKVTEEHLSQLPYLTSVFHETLRMHSPVPTLPLRYANEDTQLGGYYIPAGTQIAINVYGCNNDKNQWENPQEWKPERFLDPNKYDAMDLYKTMAFGGGKRVCAGSLQGLLIACTSIGRLVQEFEWKLRDGEEENEDTVELITHKLHPLHAILKPRSWSTKP